MVKIPTYATRHAPGPHNHDGFTPKYPPTPPTRQSGGELSLGARYAIAVEVALAIPPGKLRVPKGSLTPICERYGVNPKYPAKLMRNIRSQIDSTQELDLSSKQRKGRPSLLTPIKIAALRTVNKQNRSFTLRQVSD